MVRSARDASVLVVVVALGAGACGGNKTTSSTGAASNAPVPMDQLPGLAAHAFCDHFGACCGQAGVAFDAAQCVQSTTARFQVLLSSGAGRYDPAAGRACVNFLTATATNCGPSAKVDHSCDSDLLVGTAASGEACTKPSDCALLATCTNTPGVCLATPAGKEGDPCVGSCNHDSGSKFSDCYGLTGAAGLVCYAEDELACGSDGTCQAVPDPDGPNLLGEPCSTASGCHSGLDLYCDAGSGKCRAKKPPFSACQGTLECRGDSKCNDGKCSFILASTCTGQPTSSN